MSRIGKTCYLQRDMRKCSPVRCLSDRVVSREKNSKQALCIFLLNILLLFSLKLRIKLLSLHLLYVTIRMTVRPGNDTSNFLFSCELYFATRGAEETAIYQTRLRTT